MRTRAAQEPPPEIQRARRLRRYLEDLWVEGGHGTRHGFVTGLARVSGVKRATLTAWFSETRPKEPSLETLGAVAAVLGVTRAELVAAMDGVLLADREHVEELVRTELHRQAAAAHAEGLVLVEPARTLPGRRHGAPRGGPDR
jgi:transcriptional regulator with XRE-family HTH domain